MAPSVESENRTEPDDCASLSSSSTKSGCSFSRQGLDSLTNLDRFLESTTPVIPAQYFSKTSMRGWTAREDEFYPYFMLGDLWESFKEWSAYGAGVPLLLDGSNSVVQYYVPYLSGIQLYVDPLRPSPGLSNRRPGEDSDVESSKGTSSDGSTDCEAERGVNSVSHGGAWRQPNLTDANTQSLNRLTLRNTPLSSGKTEIPNPPGLLTFEYLERDPPFSREPLADKISILASRFPELKTYRSCDLLPSSWISVAWYPIYRIPTGHTLQNLDACFLTFHSLSTPFKSKSTEMLPNVRDVPGVDRSKVSLPIFGLASYKLKVSVWNPNEVDECQKANSLLRAADNWLRRLKVNHPDYSFFVSRDTHWR